MRAAKSLDRVGKMATRRIRSLRNIVSSVQGNQNIQMRESCLARVTIDLLNVWTQFSRNFYLSCMIGTRKSIGGFVVVSNPCMTITDAIGHAIKHYKPTSQLNANGKWHRRDEPTWHDPNVLLKLLSVQNATICPDVQAAFSARYRVFQDLPVFRNYFSHRNQSTADATRVSALNYTIQPHKRPSEILLDLPLGRTQCLLFEWMDELCFTIEFLCS